VEEVTAEEEVVEAVAVAATRIIVAK